MFNLLVIKVIFLLAYGSGKKHGSWKPNELHWVLVRCQIIFLVPVFTTRSGGGTTFDHLIWSSSLRWSFRHLDLDSSSTGCWDINCSDCVRKLWSSRSSRSSSRSTFVFIRVDVALESDVGQKICYSLFGTFFSVDQTWSNQIIMQEHSEVSLDTFQFAVCTILADP